MSFHGTQTTSYISEALPSKAELVQEIPLALSIHGVNYAVIMITPVEVEAFVMGFCFTEGIIDHPKELLDLEIIEKVDGDEKTPSHIQANVVLTGRAKQRSDQVKRQRRGATGCGLCGIEAIEQTFITLEKLSPSVPLDDEFWLASKARFHDYQQIGRLSGAIHGAMLLDDAGQTLAFAEDIGRHNALDKLIGKALIERIPLNGHHILMSSRCSTELIQKAVKSKCASLAHLASPSTLAVKQAIQYGLHLVHLPRHAAPRHYH